jgi:hypothetical protein
MSRSWTKSISTIGDGWRSARGPALATDSVLCTQRQFIGGSRSRPPAFMFRNRLSVAASYSLNVSDQQDPEAPRDRPSMDYLNPPPAEPHAEDRSAEERPRFSVVSIVGLAISLFAAFVWLPVGIVGGVVSLFSIGLIRRYRRRGLVIAIAGTVIGLGSWALVQIRLFTE